MEKTNQIHIIIPSRVFLCGLIHIWRRYVDKLHWPSVLVNAATGRDYGSYEENT